MLLLLRNLTAKFVCNMDTIAPGFFLLGLISALASFEWELIGGMASRGKTRPHVVVVVHDGVAGSSSASSTTTTTPTSTVSTTAVSARNKSWIESYLYGNRWSVPKSFFLHYYLAGTVALLTVLVYFIRCDNPTILSLSFSPTNHHNHTTRFTPATIALFICCILHCVRRSYECYYIHVFSPTAKMHGLFYITAVLYYVLIPANLFDLPLSCAIRRGAATTATIDDCYRSAYYQYVTTTNNRWTAQSPPTAATLPLHDMIKTSKKVAVVAVTCFCVWAQYQQTRHHIILANLRRDDKHRASTSSATTSYNNNATKTPSSSSSSYQIPMGGWFEYVTCPHYFAEVLLYFSYSLLIALDERWPHLSRVMSYYQENAAVTTNGYIFFLIIWECRFVVTFWFVVLNLQFSAIDNHNWYCTKFENYCKLNRKTMFPFIY